MTAAPLSDNRSHDASAEPHSWWQFSLRTFFIALTLLLVALAWYVNGPERRRRAVVAIYEAGGRVEFESDVAGRDAGLNPPKPWLPQAWWENAVEVNLG